VPTSRLDAPVQFAGRRVRVPGLYSIANISPYCRWSVEADRVHDLGERHLT